MTADRLTEFDGLIRRLLEAYKQQSAELDSLRAQHEQQCADTDQKLVRYERERHQVTESVEGMLARLERLELGESE